MLGRKERLKWLQIDNGVGPVWLNARKPRRHAILPK